MQHHSTEETLQFRFNIRERVMRRNELARKNIYKRVCNISGYSLSTVKRLVYMKMEDQHIVNYEIIRAFGIVFALPIEELENPR